jgi:hypothetical protein
MASQGKTIRSVEDTELELLMDYNFFIHEFIPLPQSLLNTLRAWSSTLTFGSTSGFRAYSGGDFWEVGAVNFGQHEPLLEYKDWLERNVFYKSIRIRAAEVNRLMPGASFSWHTDNRTKFVSSPVVNQRHRVHCYLEGDAVKIGFKRNHYDEPTVRVASFGKPFLFNDYVWHNVFNIGKLPRVSLGMQVWDEDWSWKNWLYEKRSEPAGGY